MVRTLLIRGLLVGLVAGLLVFAVGKVVGEPQVDRAIAFETAMDQAKAQADMAKGMPGRQAEPELVSRKVQASFGLFTGVVVYSAAFGGLFALVFAFAYGRIGNLRPRAVSALLALGGFVALYLVPNLKYPANPPSVGEPETIALRTGLYFSIMLISIVAMVLAVMAQRRLASRFDVWSATLLATAGYLIVITLADSMLPAINEVPDGFPAVLLWQFRMASLGMQAVMWATIGLLFGALTERAMESQFRLSAQGLMHPVVRLT
ncbi:MAG: CbtA family protein [Acetobacteraceae bacterium]|nr:CbtA family protein [Acetobacteraceae bacterium]